MRLLRPLVRFASARRLPRGVAISISLATLTALVGPTAAAQEQERRPSAREAEELPFLRIVEPEDGSIRLQVAARTFRPSAGEGPSVTLVGVAHIGDASLYEELEAVLNESEVVLYESVTPAGSKAPGGETAEERAASTRRSLGLLSGLVELFARERGRLPVDLAELETFVEGVDPRAADWLRAARTDAWGRDVAYFVDAAEDRYALVSAGADARPGGTGEASDLVIDRASAQPAIQVSGDAGIQGTLADALGLAFQLEAIDYTAEHWRRSDMTVDELSAAFAAEGLEFDLLGDTLAGSSLPAQVAKILLRLVRFADPLTDGAITDTVKVTLIEILGDEANVTRSIEQQLGRGFLEILIDRRNEVVMDDLAAILEEEPDVDSVAIFYGAGHMQDLKRRLRTRFEYEPAEVRWVDAITVDLANSPVSEEDVRLMRRLIRQSLRRSLRGAGD